MGGNWGLVINGILERRANRKEKALRVKIQNLCQHVTIEPGRNRDEIMRVAIHLHSPPGRLDWICERCGYVTSTRDHIVERWSNPTPDDIEFLIKQERKLSKLAKRVGYI